MTSLTVLGCAGSYPSADSPASSYLLADDDTCVVLDLGNGSLSQLLRHRRPEEVDAYIITHCHADHYIDLLALHVYLKHSPDTRIGPQLPITVYGPRELPTRLAHAHSPSGDVDMREVFAFRPLPGPGESATIGTFTLTAATIAHPGESYAVRVATPAGALAYSGDTGECEALVRLAADADTALFEASFLEPEPGSAPLPPDLHMTGRQAGTIARRARIRQLILTHFVQWNAQADGHPREVREAAEGFGGPVVAAKVGERFTVGATG